MRPRLIAVLAAVSLIAAACSDDGAAVTSEPSTTTAASVPTTSAIPVDPDIVPEGDPDLLAAVVFFPGDLPSPYDDLPRRRCSNRICLERISISEVKKWLLLLIDTRA